MLIKFITLQVITALLGLGIGWKRNWPKDFYKTFFMLYGGVLLSSSLFMLTWVNFGTPGTAERNVTWIQSHEETNWLLSPFTQKLNSWPHEGSSQELDILSLYADAPYKEYLSMANQGKILSGWNILIFSKKTAPLLSVFLMSSLAIGIFSAVLGIFQLINNDQGKKGSTMGVLALASAIVFLFILLNSPYLDSLGTTDEFNMRLLAALVGAKVACGHWFLLAGLFFIFLAGLTDAIWVFAPQRDKDLKFEIDDW